MAHQNKHWFNEIQNPPLTIGSLVFPAYLIPVFLSTFFLLTRSHLNHLLHQRGRPEYAYVHHLRAAPAPAPARRGFQWPELILLDPARALTFFHARWTLQALVRSGAPYRENIQKSALLETLALLFTVIFDNDPEALTSHLATATGWALFLLPSEHANLARNASALLATPCALNIFAPIGILQSTSGVLLLVLTSNIATPSATFALSAFCISLSILLRYVRAPPGHRWDNGLVSHHPFFAPLLDFLREIVRTIVGGLAMLLPLICSILLAGFCAACLGWKWIISQRPATSPLQGPHIAMFIVGSLFGWLWIARSFMRSVLGQEEIDDEAEGVRAGRPRDARTLFFRQLRICVPLLGWTVTSLVGLWWALPVIERTLQRLEIMMK